MPTEYVCLMPKFAFCAKLQSGFVNLNYYFLLWHVIRCLLFRGLVHIWFTGLFSQRKIISVSREKVSLRSFIKSVTENRMLHAFQVRIFLCSTDKVSCATVKWLALSTCNTCARCSLCQPFGTQWNDKNVLVFHFAVAVLITHCSWWCRKIRAV